MAEMKNQKFILKVAKLMENYSNIKFVLVGDGPDFPEIKEMAKMEFRGIADDPLEIQDPSDRR